MAKRAAVKKMKKWTVDATFVFGKHIGVFEAETKEEAEALAVKSRRMHVGVCHQCSSGLGGGDIELDEMHVEETGSDDREIAVARRRPSTLRG